MPPAASSHAGAWDDAQPRRGVSWREWGRRLKSRISEDNLSLIAAGVAFYALLAVFPGLGALISLYGLAFDPQQAQAQLATFGELLPPQASDVLLGQMSEVTSTERGALGLAAVGGLLLTLWSASAGVKTLMSALNVVYDEEERRGFIKFAAVALGLTLLEIIGAILAISAVVAVPAIVSMLPLSGWMQGLARLAPWPVLAVAMIIGVDILYRYGASRSGRRGPWFSRGAMTATGLWLLASLLFTLYVSMFGNYNETYGSVAGVVILLMWFLITAYVVLLGAEINAELERQERELAEARASATGDRVARALP